MCIGLGSVVLVYTKRCVAGDSKGNEKARTRTSACTFTGLRANPRDLTFHTDSGSFGLASIPERSGTFAGISWRRQTLHAVASRGGTSENEWVTDTVCFDARRGEATSLHADGGVQSCDLEVLGTLQRVDSGVSGGGNMHLQGSSGVMVTVKNALL